MTIKSLSSVICFEVTISSLKQCFGDDYKNLLLFSIFRNSIQSNYFLNELFQEGQMYKLFHLFKLQMFKKGEVVYDMRSSDNRLLISIEGDLYYKSGQLASKRGQVFGEDHINKNILFCVN